MSAAKNLILVTGGNAGIGFELVSQLLATAGNHVILGARSKSKGSAAVSDLQSRKLPGTVELLDLDVCSSESITAAAESVEASHGHLDALVNNAGIGGVPEKPLGEQMAIIFATNVIGPQLMGDTFLPLLKKSRTTPRIVNVSSGLGSITMRLDPSSPYYNINSPQYRVSKAAVNMITAGQRVIYGEDNVKVFSYCPGFTVSGLSPTNNADHGAKPTSEGARPILNILNGERDAENGGFLHEDGIYPW